MARLDVVDGVGVRRLAASATLPPPVSEAISAFVTSDMLATWQDRAVNGPFKSDGDYATNSPGDWDRITSSSATFDSTPPVGRWSGPSGSGQVNFQGSTVDDPEYDDHWKFPLSAALVALINDDTTLANKVADELIAQSQVARLDFANESVWYDANGTDLNPAFEVATFVAGYLVAMDWVDGVDPDAFSTSERAAAHRWFFDFAEWAYRELVTAYNKRFTNHDYQTAPPWSGHVSASSWDLAYDGAPSEVGNTARFFNNRRNSMVRAVGMIAEKLLDAEYDAPTTSKGYTLTEMRTGAVNMAKGWIVYSCYPTGYMGEFQRINTSTGLLHYPWQTVSPILGLAHALTVSGGSDLFTWTTEAGADGSASPGETKSLPWIVSEMAKYTEQNTYDRTKGGATLGLQSGSTEQGHDQSAAPILFPHGDTSYLKPAVERTLPGMSGWKSGMRGYGSRSPWVADWGVWPAVHFLFNGVEV